MITMKERSHSFSSAAAALNRRTHARQVVRDIAGLLPHLADGADGLFHDAFHFGVATAIGEGVAADARLLRSGGLHLRPGGCPSVMNRTPGIPPARRLVEGGLLLTIPFALAAGMGSPIDR